ncbi:SAM-dependent methyltransferase [Clostridium oryzae]|uniref:Cyclopropane-fatty-acyl-phospholipid synthase n=1 Tax=Clostridium oryzae TaxID=1450648 RepID=A0A1V4IBR9_9CLOT|nr:cyclopropane-fatty-acyl-phospholipid synthase family protein [Clostridium oryzae]OPJ57320.1 cyclopropane-fatty-acyl-phospholipid synthase [Clostridium oryzae]
MGIDKLFYSKMFKTLFSDPCEVQYWDGDIEKYGEGESKFKIIINKPIPKTEIINDPSMAFGEGYMNRDIDIEGSVQDVIESLYNNKDSFLKNGEKYVKLLRKVTNNIRNSRENIHKHYDIGNDFYKLWLDDTMTYSCGYFRSAADSLTQAQHNKVNHILKKLDLKEGQTLLDIGCGWGELIINAAKQYKVKALGITLSDEQYKKVKERIQAEGLTELVDVKVIDYRELKDVKFDRVVSVGMVEHVGKDHLTEYFDAIDRLLNDGGISMLHCITGIKRGGTNTWIDTYIFPGGYVPAVKELVNEISDKGFYLLDAESLRRHYGKTLECWARNFENSIDEVVKMKDETFIRMWRLYLNACAASFNRGNIDIHQFMFSKGLADELPWTREYMYK